MKKNFILAGFGLLTLMPLSYAMQRPGEGNVMETSANVGINANTGVSTSMNGNTSADGGVSVSSTSASRESRNTSGNGD